MDETLKEVVGRKRVIEVREGEREGRWEGGREAGREEEREFRYIEREGIWKRKKIKRNKYKRKS